MINSHLHNFNSCLTTYSLSTKPIVNSSFLTEENLKTLDIKEFKSVYTASYIIQFAEKYKELNHKYKLDQFVFTCSTVQMNSSYEKIVNFLSKCIRLMHFNEFENCNLDYDQTFYETHREFICHVRYFSHWQVPVECDQPLYHHVVNFAQELCSWLYSSPQLWDSMTQFMEETLKISLDFDEQLISSNFKENFRLMGQFFHRQCEQVILPKAKKPELDLHASGDFPSVLFQMKSKAWVIRTPTVGLFIADPNNRSLYDIKVAPDFISYLSSLLEGESHLYIRVLPKPLILDFGKIE